MSNILTKLNAMQLMALLCWMTMLKPNLLFMIARRHMMHTCTSSVVSPIFSLVECLNILLTRGPSKSSPEDLTECDDFIVPLFFADEEVDDVEKRASLKMLSSNDVLCKKKFSQN